MYLRWQMRFQIKQVNPHLSNMSHGIELFQGSIQLWNIQTSYSPRAVSTRCCCCALEGTEDCWLRCWIAFLVQTAHNDKQGFADTVCAKWKNLLCG
jgi:hypothetical protein